MSFKNLFGRGKGSVLVAFLILYVLSAIYNFYEYKSGQDSCILVLYVSECPRYAVLCSLYYVISCVIWLMFLCIALWR